jgi:hypothetical protein
VKREVEERVPWPGWRVRREDETTKCSEERQAAAEGQGR